MRPATRLRPALNLLRQSTQYNARRTLIAAPKPGEGPLMTRRADRELPSLPSRTRYLWTLPVFGAILAVSAAAIFNYQKLSSSVVGSTLYALRTSAQARSMLGDEIYFASKVPWIWGTIDQLHGRIDIEYSVKGTRGRGKMRFRSERRSRMSYVGVSAIFLWFFAVRALY